MAVFPPIMVDPPRNTECLDQPGGPQTMTWLATDVRQAVLDRFRVTHEPAGWNVAGYSTGGYCAAALLFNHRDRFGAAAVVGGYFHAWADATTGDLFAGDDARQGDSEQAIGAARRWPGTASIVLDRAATVTGPT